MQELERRKEEVLEEFLELSFAAKHEAVEALKQECKRLKTPKDQEKKQLTELQKQMDSKRKEGMNELAKKMQTVIYDQSIPMMQRVERLNDKDTITQIINQLLQDQKNEGSQGELDEENKQEQQWIKENHIK